MDNIKIEWRQAIEQALHEKDMELMVFGNVDCKKFENKIKEIDYRFRNKIRLSKLQKIND
jgi:hypothetical protein